VPGSRSYRSPSRSALRAVRRWWRRIRRRLTGTQIRFVYHGDYQRSLAWLPFDNRRGERILSYLAEEGLLVREDIRTPRRPALRAFLRVHDAAYLESLQDHAVLERVFGERMSDPDLESLVELQRMWTGGTILATRLAVQGRSVVFNLGGGLHHALRDAGMGFCLVNDIAIAIARMRSRGFSGNILVIDLDMHDGNGTRAIFANDPTVYTYSIHDEHWSDTAAEASTAIALGGGIEDDVFLGTLLKTLPDVVETVDPALAVYVAGTDPAADDVRGSWYLSPEGMLSRDRFVIDLLRRPARQVPVAVVLGGGYGDRAWRYTAAFAGWLYTGRSVMPPDNEELLLRRFRRIGRTLEPTELETEPDRDDWGLTDEDLLGIAPEARAPTRFLDRFSRHGVELLLERFGILDQLRVRGFEFPCVVLDLSHPLGQTLRIFGDADRDELLMELRVNRDRRLVPDHDLMVVEWLLLQNPRAQFGPYRRPLPGQNHPGLGMLKDVLGWLVVVAEMLELDGLYFLPSAYHVAAQSRNRLRFLEPRHEAVFRELQRVLDAFELSSASRAVSDGGLTEADGEIFEWRPYPMVLPVSDRMKEIVFGDPYERRVDEAAENLEYRLAGIAEA
jgi:acetoin utilization deacetylase AcuC-like enzyme